MSSARDLRAGRLRAAALWLWRLPHLLKLLVLAIVVGVVFRTLGYWVRPMGLWYDEVWWANRTFEWTLDKFKFRPIAYIAVTRALTHLYVGEQTFRLLSWLPGILSLPIGAYVASRLFASRLTRLLCVFVIAFHPWLIDMAREFKPYSLEFCAHLTLIALYLRYRATESRRWFLALLGFIALIFPFAYNVAFAFPGVLLLVALPLLKERKLARLGATVAAGAVALASAVFCYVYAISKLDVNGEVNEIAGGDVFFDGRPGASGVVAHAAWLVSKYAELFALPGAQRKHWSLPHLGPELLSALQRADTWLWIGLAVAGLCVLIRRKDVAMLTLLLGPLAFAGVCNFPKLWPMGAFRSNMFLLAQLILIPMFAVDALLENERPRLRRAGGLVTALLLVPSLTLGLDSHSVKRNDSKPFWPIGLTQTLEQLRADPRLRNNPMPRVLLDPYSCEQLYFYPYRHDGYRVLFPHEEKRFDFYCLGHVTGKAPERLGQMKNKLFLLVITEDEGYDDLLARYTRVLVHTKVHDLHDVYLLRGK